MIGNRRVDNIKVCDAWIQLEGVASEEGLIALGYQRSKYGAATRVYQFAKLYLYSPAASVRLRFAIAVERLVIFLACRLPIVRWP